jgi:hypothetical protein
MEYNMTTLKTLVRNQRELLLAEKRILQAIAIDYQEGIETDPYVTKKLFEISDLILALNENIKKCQEEIRKK